LISCAQKSGYNYRAKRTSSPLQDRSKKLSKLQELLRDQPIILADGAMGTMLFAAGLVSGQSPELWNVEYPDRVQAIHRGYVEAGTQLILTNSFGGNRFRLVQHGLEARLHELNRAAAENARQVADSARQLVLVGGSIGPTSRMLEPFGDLSIEEAIQAFTEQAKALQEGGIDYFQVETMSDLKEAEAAIHGIRHVSDLPIIATMSFDTKGRTMMGVKPADASRRLIELGATVIGANCGTGPDEMIRSIEQMAAATPEAVLLAKSNAGVPKENADGSLTYDGTPEIMANYAVMIRDKGARIIGACCGSSPEHIQAMREALKI
jgi:5-methyltetrahydrofolate--homocysteine methyltransferase